MRGFQSGRFGIAALRKLRSQSSGFTLIELVVIVAILGVMMVIALPSLSPTKRRLQQLRTDYESVLDILNRARFGALTGASDWMVEVQCDTLGGTLRLGADDGWLRTDTMVAMRANSYFPGNPDYDVDQRGDNGLSATEVIFETQLSKNVRLLQAFGDLDDSIFACPDWVKFKRDGSVLTPTSVGTMLALWIADENFTRSVGDVLELQGQMEWMKPIFILPTGAVHLPYSN